MAAPLRTASNPVTVWYWPVRVTHWLIFVLVVAQFVTAELLDGAMSWHARGGYVVLALVLFRLSWGFVGDRHARFSDFLYTPTRVIGYARALRAGTPPPHAGHNPLGGWSVVALLGLLGAQAVSGLFASDDVFTEGPLYAHASEDLSNAMIGLHHLCSKLLLALVAIHVGAVLYHAIRCKENLLGPMLHGRKHQLPDEYVATPRTAAHPWIALLLMLLAGGAVAAVVLVAQATAPETLY